jgi:periplasmic protein TonB
MIDLRPVGVVLVAFSGFVLVMGSLLVMNRPAKAPQENQRVSSIDYSLPTPPPKPPPQRQERRETREETIDRPQVAPAPDLGANLSGIAVAVPGFDVQGIDTISDSLLGDLDNLTLSDDAVDTAPIPQYRPLAYPDRAKQRQIEGTVLVSALVDASGNVLDVRILESNPPKVFDEAVLSALPNWTFEPAQYKGQPVKTWVEIPIPFRLN